MALPLSFRLSRRVELSAGGKLWPVLFTHDALLDLWELTGLDAMAGQISLVRPSGKLLRAALFVVLKHAGATFSLQQAGELLRLGGMARIRVALLDAWEASMPEPEKRRPTGEGKEREPLSWMEAWAIGHENLRLSDQEWLAMTPRMLQALSRQRLENMRWQELQMGTIVAYGANFSMCAPKQPFQPKSFMFHPWPEDEDRGLTGEEIQAVLHSLPEMRKPQRIN